MKVKKIVIYPNNVGILYVDGFYDFYQSRERLLNIYEFYKLDAMIVQTDNSQVLIIDDYSIFKPSPGGRRKLTNPETGETYTY